MKVISVPYSKSTQRFIEKTLVMIVIIGGFSILVAVLSLNWKLILIVLPLVIGSGYLLYLLLTLQLIPITNDILDSITNINEYGFELKKQGKVKAISWNTIEAVGFNADFTALILTKRRGEPLSIDSGTYNWYKLIQNIPTTFENFNRAYVEQFLKSLSTCKICGAIAIQNNKCLSCGNDVWSEELLSEYQAEEEYIKLHQLPIFATWDEQSQIELYIQSDDGFQLDKSWQPLVTEEQVREYSKENNWVSPFFV